MQCKAVDENMQTANDGIGVRSSVFKFIAQSSLSNIFPL